MISRNFSSMARLSTLTDAMYASIDFGLVAMLNSPTPATCGEITRRKSAELPSRHCRQEFLEPIVARGHALLHWCLEDRIARFARRVLDRVRQSRLAVPLGED